jgi:hypothetical protein
MPTDGTLVLEYMPKSKQYLVTALSVFFSLGAVLTAVAALLLVPANSCAPAPAPCDPATENVGWRYLLGALCLVVRFFFFRASGNRVPSLKLSFT